MENGSTTGGYVTDVAYAESFFRELSPSWLSYVANLNGHTVRDLKAPFTYLELGCGHGRSALINAAAFPHATFHACDLNPAHIAAAQQTAAVHGIHNIRLHQSGFAELLEHELPSCDFIVLHGVYSWVDASARATLRAILAAKLRTGGLAYLSYNCLPGWSSEAPLRKLLLELAASESGDSGQRSAHALQSLLQLSAGKLQFLTANPAANAALASYQRNPLNYLVHEFMNHSWELFYGVDLADELREIGLEYAGSATLAENHPMLLMDERTASTIAALPTERQRRLASDFAINQRFRRDVFIRWGGTREPPSASLQLAQTLLGCVRPRELARSTIRVPRGEVTLQPDFMQEVRELFSAGPLSIAQAVSSLHRGGRDAAGLTRNLLFLVAGGALQPCARNAGSTAPRSNMAQISYRYATPTVQQILCRSADQGSAAIVPSPVLGNGIELEPGEVLAVVAVVEGHTDATVLSQQLEHEFTSRVLDSRSEQSTLELAHYVVAELAPALLRFEVLANAG